MGHVSLAKGEANRARHKWRRQYTVHLIEETSLPASTLVTLKEALRQN